MNTSGGNSRMSITNILIVEDEVIVALDIRARLESLGHSVLGLATTGEEAIKAVEQTIPDLVLMDVRLKGELDGIETAGILRKRFGVPAVYLTAYGDDETLHRAKFTEPYGFLIKPFEERELHGTIEMALYKIAMEKSLRQQTSRLEQVMATIPEGIALFDASNRLLTSNLRARQYLLDLGVINHDNDDQLAETFAEPMVKGRDTGIWQDHFAAGPPPRTYEAVATSVATGNVVHQTDNDSLEWLLVLRDVTNERQIQQRVQFHERLASIGQLAAGIAHDFNNILSSIMVFAEVIRSIEPNLSPKSRDRLDMIEQQGRRASNLIKQLLAFSRSSTVDTQPVDLAPLLHEQQQVLMRLIPENIQVVIDYLPGSYVVSGDATQIQQVLMNLALNARDAMLEGGRLCIELLRHAGEISLIDQQPQGQNWIVIKVSDTGIGIDPQDLPHIFEPFYTTKAPGKGTGLGLAQVYGIVRQHRGTVQVESCPEKGTRFTVFLPAHALDGSVAAEDRISVVTPPGGHGQSILVVEDDPNVRQSVSDILEVKGYQVLAVPNGLVALETINRQDIAINLVLSDLVMPEMGGVELCAGLRETGYDGPIVIMSGFISEETRQQLEPLTIASYLAKPLGIDRLLGIVAEVLAESRTV